MFFKSVSLKKKKPNTGLLRNKVVLINDETKEVMAFQLGMATDWEYFEARGWTHWIKSIPYKELIPDDDEVGKWFEDNIGTQTDCSASSAIYKFRLWLKDRIISKEALAKTNTNDMQSNNEPSDP